MAKKNVFKMNEANKMTIVSEFVMKMRDQKVIYALRKAIEKDLKISFGEYLAQHTKSVETAQNLFSDASKLLTYKRNKEIVKLDFDVNKINLSWQRSMEKITTPSVEAEVAPTKKATKAKKEEETKTTSKKTKKSSESKSDKATKVTIEKTSKSTKVVRQKKEKTATTKAKKVEKPTNVEETTNVEVPSVVTA